MTKFQVTRSRVVPLQKLSLSYMPVIVNGFKTDYSVITVFNSIKPSDRRNTS